MRIAPILINFSDAANKNPLAENMSALCGISISTTAPSRCSRPAASGSGRWRWPFSMTTRDCAATPSGTCRRPPPIWYTDYRRRFRSVACPVPAPKNPEPRRRSLMNTKKLLALWGLKWNPFSPELPSEALLVTPRIESFAWRVEQLVQEGGFALISGESGTGKSVALRIVAQRLAALRDVLVGVLERPQSKTTDFYRELGDIFAVKL